MDEHHWLGHRMAGETMRYVATDSDGEWVALVGFASCAFSCGPRDRFVGWSPEAQLRRLRFVASNQRFCVLPAGRRQNAASAVMARTLRRLSSDWVSAWGHPVLLVETFVDPSRHLGTCYAASSFQRVGATSGYGRRSGRYVAHGEVKDVYVKALHRRAVELLAGAFDHPLLFADRRSSLALLDFNTADLSSLAARLDAITDPRDPRGVRHSFASTLVLVACATLAGHKSLTAMSEWSDASSQEVLRRVGARASPSSGQRTPPSYATIRRAVMAVDADEFDLIVNAWAAEQPDRYPQPVARHESDSASGNDESGADDDRPGSRPTSGGLSPGAGLLGVAVDGKTLRGAKRSDGTQVQLLAAMRHDTGMVIGQRNVDNDKTNEILAFAPLVGPLALAGIVLTADAIHTQRKAAELVVATKAGHYIFGVKKNQPTLWNAGVDALGRIDIDQPEHEALRRGHGRIDRHRVWTAPVPTGVGFPHAKRFIFVERESSTLTSST